MQDNNNHDEMFMDYISVCNQALALNKERFPFKQILGAASKAENNKNIEVHITGGSSNNNYVIAIENDQITAHHHGDCKNCQCDRIWKIDQNYIREVTRNPALYINNPAKINWEWMYDHSR